MVECKHCGDTFQSEEAYLDHLAAEHATELGAIERRRIEGSRGGTGDGGLPTWGLLVGGASLAVVVVVVWFAFFMGDGGGGGVDADPTGLESKQLPGQGASRWISQVESFPSNGNDHVDTGSQIEYERIPPLSGTHYGNTVGAGFYDETPALGSLVHTLEHGAVVVYYDPDALTPEAEASLRAWAKNHRGTWSSIVVAPHPKEDPEHPYVLTAWRHELTLDEYDAEAVQAFAAEYLGRGPENPVR